jgi:hypothetical protein
MSPSWDDRVGVLLHTTFCRFAYVQRTIASLRDRYRCYIADTGPITAAKLDYYRDLEREGHRPFMIPWDVSPAETRNFMIDQMVEPYVLKFDDDYELSPEARVPEIIALLEACDDLAVVGMAVYSGRYQSRFIFRVEEAGGHMTLSPIPEPEVEEHEGLPYYRCDVVPDCWVAKRAIFPECAWDERYHVSEGLHTDFFLHILYETDWNVAYCPSARVYTFKHEFELTTKDRKRSFYNRKRHRRLGNKDQILAKWNLKSISNC